MKRDWYVWLIALLGVFFLASGVIAAGQLIHPLDFTGTDAEKKAVISLIKERVKAQYKAIGMDDPLTLKMMEEEHLNAFKQLMQAKDRKLLDRVMAQYCGIGMCDYLTINMMYEEQLKASKKDLKW